MESELQKYIYPFYCSYNDLTSLDLSQNIALLELDCSSNDLTLLDISQNVALWRLECSVNSLTSLDVSNNAALQKLFCINNGMEYIDLSDLKELKVNEIYLAQRIILGEISDTGIQLGMKSAGMDFSRVINVTGATFDVATGTLTGYTASPVTYTYEAVDANGNIWPMKITLEFTIKHVHSFGTDYTYDEDNHWNVCACGAIGNVSAHTPGPVATEDSAQTCTVCGYEIAPALGHQHSFGTTYSSDVNNHWNTYACGATGNVSAHVPGPAATEDSAQTCTVCGYEIAPRLEHVHSYGITYSSDANNHWNTCDCGEKGNVNAHDFEWVVDKPATESAAGSKHEECGICGYEKMSVEIPKLQPAEDDGEDVDDEEDEAPVQANVKDDVPKTGDSSAMTVIVWGSIALLSGAGIAVFGKKRANGR